MKTSSWRRSLVLVAVAVVTPWFWACSTTPSRDARAPSSSSSEVHWDDGGGAGFGRNSAEARITHLISEGQFTEAEALIAESASSGVIEHSAAAVLRRTIAEQAMKLGELPASLQRVGNFPARLKDFSRYQIQRMLQQKDFSIATKKELQTALKLLKEHKRLMEKN
ncbi:MAG TPA: hypothetical protein VF815_13515 [Myxococcaceae bacterium]